MKDKSSDLHTPLAQLALLNKLAKELKFNKIRATFSGGGDQGTVDSWEIHWSERGNSPQRRSLLTDPNRVRDVESEINQMLGTNLAYDLIDQFPYDWVNNEGGSGYVDIAVPSGKVTIHFNINEIISRSSVEHTSLIPE